MKQLDQLIIRRTPESDEKSLTLEEYKIIFLIYNIAIASLMSDAILEDTKVDVENSRIFV